MAFPGTARHSETENPCVPVPGLIVDLVPEARVITHHVFDGHATRHPLHLYPEDEDGPIEEQAGRGSASKRMSSAAREAAKLRTADEADKREISNGPDVDISEGNTLRPNAAEAVRTFDSDKEGTIGDSEPIASAATYQLHPASIEEEALALLESIHENAPIDKTGNRNKVLLAGYGFGGIIVKQVFKHPSTRLCNWLPDTPRLSLSPTRLLSTTMLR